MILGAIAIGAAVAQAQTVQPIRAIRSISLAAIIRTVVISATSMLIAAVFFRWWTKGGPEVQVWSRFAPQGNAVN